MKIARDGGNWGSTGFDWHDFRPKDYLLGESIADFALFRLLDSVSYSSVLARSK